MTELQLLYEAVKEARAEIHSVVKELRGEMHSLRSQQCDLHGELSEVKELVARIDERQKAQPAPAQAIEPSNKSGKAVAVTFSVAGIGATVWGILKALSSGSP